VSRVEPVNELIVRGCLNALKLIVSLLKIVSLFSYLTNSYLTINQFTKKYLIAQLLARVFGSLN
jgi:hypothetical protein